MQHHNFLGKYRALVLKVENSKSPTTRIKVKCPKVLGDSSSGWCLACVPFVKDKTTLKAPEVGDPVWVEFEDGDLSKPIWTGTWR